MLICWIFGDLFSKDGQREGEVLGWGMNFKDFKSKFAKWGHFSQVLNQKLVVVSNLGHFYFYLD